MRLIVAGSRSIDKRVCMTTLDALLHDDEPPCIGRPTEIVCGGARGPDTAGFDWGWAHGIPVKTFVPDWRRLGKAAGPERNERMARYAAADIRGRGALLAFWDGVSPGTRNMINLARAHGLHVTVIR